MLYELANRNRLPFAESSYISEKANHRRLLGEILPAPCRADQDLARVILKACAFDADDRYQTAAELRTALKMLEESGVSTCATRPTIPNSNSYSTMFASSAGGAVGYGTIPANSYGGRDDNSIPNTGRNYRSCESNHLQNEKTNNKVKKYLPVLLAVVAVLVVLLCTILSKCKEHDWKEATCTSARECLECGETEGSPLGHVWTAATCTQPEICSSCGATSGSALGHAWIAATYSAPKTCNACGATEGSRLVADPIYLNELGVSYHIGKIWTRSQNAPSGSYHTNSDARSNSKNASICWSNWSTPGYTPGTVKDQAGNKYTYGIFIDGSESRDYYMEFDLDGKYTTFSGTCACPDRDSAISSYVYYNASTLYSKYFEVYLDGKYIGSSPSMRADYSPQTFEFDVTGGETLKIVYPATSGPNEIASIYDGMLK